MNNAGNEHYNQRSEQAFNKLVVPVNKSVNSDLGLKPFPVINNNNGMTYIRNGYINLSFSPVLMEQADIIFRPAV